MISLACGIRQLFNRIDVPINSYKIVPTYGIEIVVSYLKIFFEFPTRIDKKAYFCCYKEECRKVKDRFSKRRATFYVAKVWQNLDNSMSEQEMHAPQFTFTSCL